MESNRIIAEFMGVDTHYEAQSSNMFNQYHTSWDRLMPVVHKCCILNNEEGFEPFYDLCELKIATTHKAVVEFIKNQNT